MSWLEEDDAVMEGAVPSAWIIKNFLRWPKTKYQNAVMRREMPKENWKYFKVLKTKLVDSMFILLIHYYNFL